jgi:hypothetical protein
MTERTAFSLDIFLLPLSHTPTGQAADSILNDIGILISCGVLKKIDIPLVWKIFWKNGSFRGSTRSAKDSGKVCQAPLAVFIEESKVGEASYG